MAKILLVDDDPSLREVLAFTLREQGHEVVVAGSGEAGIKEIEASLPEVVITDLKMPGIDGLELLERTRVLDPAIPVILLTAFGSIEAAVEAMKRGAHDYLTKPYNREELRVTLDHALESRRLMIENRELRSRLREQTRRIDIVHASESMARILEMVRRIAPTDATVLLTGESGTGKEVIAHAIHSESDRWEKPFVAINCAAIPKDLMESELFGYVRGAFTGATKDKPGKFRRAEGGTLFLDEIGDLPAELQTKLLRTIETRQVDPLGGSSPVQIDVRLIAATNADLDLRVREGTFRSDLFYRLNVIPIRIPPLRERPDDIPALWDHFVLRFAGDRPVRTDPGLLRALMRRPWPGNVRELANLAQRMVLLRQTGVLTLEELPSESTEEPPQATDSTGLLGPLPEGRLPLFALEREVIVRALEKHGGNRTKTAEYLDIPRHVLIYRLEKFNIDL